MGDPTRSTRFQPTRIQPLGVIGALKMLRIILTGISTGKGGEDELKFMVATIHNIKEKLKGENDELKKIKHKLKEIQEKQKAEKEVCRIVARNHKAGRL